MAISGFYVGLYGVFKILSAAFSTPKQKGVGERFANCRRNDCLQFEAGTLHVRGSQ